MCNKWTEMNPLSCSNTSASKGLSEREGGREMIFSAYIYMQGVGGKGEEESDAFGYRLLTAL